MIENECPGYEALIGLGYIEISTGSNAADEKIVNAYSQISDYILDIEDEINAQGKIIMSFHSC